MPIENMSRRLLERTGESATITEYTQSGTDDYGDPTFTSTSTSVLALFRQPTDSITEISTPGGTVHTVDAQVFVSSEYRDKLSRPRDDQPRASEITRSATGESFTVLDVWDESNGQLRVAVMKADD